MKARLHPLLAGLLLLALPHDTRAAYTAWQTTGTGDWLDNANWSANAPTDANDYAVIGVSGTALLISGSASVGTASGSQLLLQGGLGLSGDALLTGGNLVVSGGNLRLWDTAQFTGVEFQTNSGGEVSLGGAASVSVSNNIIIGSYGTGNTLSLSGNATMATGGQFQLLEGAMASVDIAAWINHGAIITANGINLSGTLNLLSLELLSPGDSVTLIQSATPYSNTGGAAVLVNGVFAPPSEVAGGAYTFEWNGGIYEVNLYGNADGTDAVLSMLNGVAVPEPGAWAALLLGGGVVAVFGRRTRAGSCRQRRVAKDTGGLGDTP